MVDLHLDDEDDMMREGRESNLVGWVGGWINVD